MAPLTDKQRNESYFNRLGSENAQRSENLPPSQGGKYGGFGNTPAPSAHNDSLDVNDILNDPAAALSKGWSLLSTTLVAGANMINENVIKPTAATVTDPDFQNKVGGYVSSIGQKVNFLTRPFLLCMKNACTMCFNHSHDGVRMISDWAMFLYI